METMVDPRSHTVGRCGAELTIGCAEAAIEMHGSALRALAMQRGDVWQLCLQRGEPARCP